MSEGESWAQWCRWFERSEQELYGALHTRWMWQTISGVIDGSGVKKHPTLLNYLSHTYATTVSTFVRRQASDDRHDAGLARCLRLLVRRPNLVTRSSWLGQRAANVEFFDSMDSSGFDAYAPAGGSNVERVVLESALERLRLAAAPVKKYVDNAIAHSSQSATLQPADITFGEIDHALIEVEAVFKQFYGIRYPGTMLATGTPVANLSFLRMFEQPWFPAGSSLPSRAASDQF